MRLVDHGKAKAATKGASQVAVHPKAGESLNMLKDTVLSHQSETNV